MSHSIFTLDVLQTLVRAVLKIGGGAMIAKAMADNDAVQAIGSGVIAAVAVVWGMFQRQKPKTREALRAEDALGTLVKITARGGASSACPGLRSQTGIE